MSLFQLTLSITLLIILDCDPIIISAINDFTPSDSEAYVPYYINKSTNALAVDASKYKGEFALAEYTFTGNSGVYLPQIVTLSENDGESYYRLLLNGKHIDEIQNMSDSINYAKQKHDFEKINLKKGDKIGIAFNAHTNGQIPEGNSTAYSRGRWTMLTLIPQCK